MKIAIVKYNAGNIQSVLFALERLGYSGFVTDDPEDLKNADKVIFPGQGEASSAMKYLKEKNLHKIIKNLKQPLLGICLGMQLLADFSEEGNTECLGIIPSRVRKFDFDAKNPLPVPQIGWNKIFNLKSDLFRNIPNNSFVYFIHSYYFELGQWTISEANYGINFSAAVKYKNFYGTQFHPEKSGDTGEKILKNFLEIDQD